MATMQMQPTAGTAAPPAGATAPQLAPANTSTAKPARHPAWVWSALAAGGFVFGSLLWIAASSLFVASQNRFFGLDLRESRFRAAYVLAIIGSAAWFIASIFHLVAVHAEIGAHFPPHMAPAGLSRQWIAPAWLQLIGTLLVLIGSAIVGGASLSSVDGGGTIWLIGFTIWAIALFIRASSAFMVATMALMMHEQRQRHHAWSDMACIFGALFALAFYILGSIMWHLQSGGAWVVAGLMMLIASIFLFLSSLHHAGGVMTVYSPSLHLLHPLPSGMGKQGTTGAVAPPAPVPVPAPATSDAHSGEAKGMAPIGGNSVNNHATPMPAATAATATPATASATELAPAGYAAPHSFIAGEPRYGGGAPAPASTAVNIHTAL